MSLLGHLAGHGEEREGCINGDILEERYFGKYELLEFLEIGNPLAWRRRKE